jgi:predicted NBD/HSP70 family sugar kinase
MPKGSNAQRQRAHNEQRLLYLLRREGRLTKPALAAAMQLSLPALTRIVDDLLQRNLLVATGETSRGVGQPARYFTLNAGASYRIGLGLGREHQQLVMVDFCGHACWQHRQHIPLTAQPLSETLWQLLTPLLADAEFGTLAKACLSEHGIGIAMPWALADFAPPASMPLHPPSDKFFTAIDGDTPPSMALEMQPWAASLPFPVQFDNDGNAAALAQWYHSCCAVAKDHRNAVEISECSAQHNALASSTAIRLRDEMSPHSRNASQNITSLEPSFDMTASAITQLRQHDWLYLYLDTYPGAGLIVEQQLYRGRRANAAHIAALRVPAPLMETAHGQHAPSAFTPAQAYRLADIASLAQLTAALSFDGANAIDAATRPPRNQHSAIQALAYGLHCSCTLLDLTQVVVDSSEPTLLPLLLPLLQQALADWYQQPAGASPCPNIYAGTQGENAVALGAAIMQLPGVQLG